MEDEKKESKFNFTFDSCNNITVAERIDTVNNYANKEAEKQKKERPTFEEAIVKRGFGTGLFMAAWNQLRNEGFLTEDYQLGEKTSRKTAAVMIAAFSNKYNEINGIKNGENLWKPFESFWDKEHLKNDLKQASSENQSDEEKKIYKIFRELK